MVLLRTNLYLNFIIITFKLTTPFIVGVQLLGRSLNLKIPPNGYPLGGGAPPDGHTPLHLKEVTLPPLRVVMLDMLIPILHT